MEVIAAAEICLDGQPSELFLSGLQKLEQRAKKCIELHGEYVEEISSLVSVASFLPCRAKDLSATPHILTEAYFLMIFLGFTFSWLLYLSTMSFAFHNLLLSDYPLLNNPLNYEGFYFKFQ